MKLVGRYKSEKNIRKEYVEVTMLLKSLGLEEFPKNSLLLVEEDLGEIKSTFLQLLVLDFLRKGKTVMYISTKRSSEDILNEIELVGLKTGAEMKNLTIQGNFKSRESFVEICNSFFEQQDLKSADICIVDTFSSLFMEESLQNLRTDLNLLLNICGKCNITFLLASDIGVLEERPERFLRSMTDGIIQFRTEYLAGKISRFINIPKMRGVPLIDRLIPFKMKEGVISPDVRERVG
jgi:KaiC/GvpD/RAD55 family RecA-like ATPase